MHAQLKRKRQTHWEWKRGRK